MPPLPRSSPSPPGTSAARCIEIAGATILNDSYNSNPEALRSMIRTLAARPAAGRRILVAGEMLELGEHGPALHAACGRAAAEAGLDLVAGVRAMRNTLPPPHAPEESLRSSCPTPKPPATGSSRISAPATSCSSKALAASTSNAPSKLSRRRLATLRDSGIFLAENERFCNENSVGCR